MEEWIPFKEGKYHVEQGFLVAPDHTAVVLYHCVIEVFIDTLGRRKMDGRGQVNNLQMVELLDDHEDLDILLDLGPGFRYLLERPLIKSGKFFSPDVRSAFQFLPSRSWEPIADAAFEKLLTRLKTVDDEPIQS